MYKIIFLFFIYLIYISISTSLTLSNGLITINLESTELDRYEINITFFNNSFTSSNKYPLIYPPLFSVVENIVLSFLSNVTLVSNTLVPLITSFPNPVEINSSIINIHSNLILNAPFISCTNTTIFSSNNNLTLDINTFKFSSYSYFSANLSLDFLNYTGQNFYVEFPTNSKKSIFSIIKSVLNIDTFITQNHNYVSFEENLISFKFFTSTNSNIFIKQSNINSQSNWVVSDNSNFLVTDSTFKSTLFLYCNDRSNVSIRNSNFNQYLSLNGSCAYSFSRIRASIIDIPSNRNISFSNSNIVFDNNFVSNYLWLSIIGEDSSLNFVNLNPLVTVYNSLFQDIKTITISQSIVYFNNCFFNTYTEINGRLNAKLSLFGLITVGQGLKINIRDQSSLIFSNNLSFQDKNIEVKFYFLNQKSNIVAQGDSSIANSKIYLAKTQSNLEIYSLSTFSFKSSIVSIDANVNFTDSSINLYATNIIVSGELYGMKNLYFDSNSTLEPKIASIPINIYGSFNNSRLKTFITISNEPSINLVDIKYEDFIGDIIVFIDKLSYISNTDIDFQILRFSSSSCSCHTCSNNNINISFDFSITANSSNALLDVDYTPTIKYYYSGQYFNKTTLSLSIKFITETGTPKPTRVPPTPSVTTSTPVSQKSEPDISKILIGVIVSVCAVISALIVITLVYFARLRKMRQTNYVKENNNIEFLVFR